MRRLITRHAGDGVTRRRSPACRCWPRPTTTAAARRRCSSRRSRWSPRAPSARRSTAASSPTAPASTSSPPSTCPSPGTSPQPAASEPFLAVGSPLQPGAIAALLLETGAGRPRPRAARSGIASSDASAALLDAVVAAAARCSTARADRRALGAGLEREILWRLITGPQGAMVRQIGLADSRLAHLGRAIRLDPRPLRRAAPRRGARARWRR